jgi:uncharacterized damage-inducible protein DinB
VTTVVEDAFGHHVWATDRLLEACAALTSEQLDTAVPGTYGSIISTLRHLVGGDAGYLQVLSDDPAIEVDEGAATVNELRRALETISEGWRRVARGGEDPDEKVVRHRDDGTDSSAPRSIRLVQAFHHGTDHRSQICTALTTLGIEPPEIDVWAYADAGGRIEVTSSRD